MTSTARKLKRRKSAFTYLIRWISVYNCLILRSPIRELNNAQALEQAKVNVKRHFHVVGVLEQLNCTLRIAERRITTFFGGVQQMYFNELLGKGNEPKKKFTFHMIDSSKKCWLIIKSFRAKEEQKSRAAKATSRRLAIGTKKKFDNGVHVLCVCEKEIAWAMWRKRLERLNSAQHRVNSSHCNSFSGTQTCKEILGKYN